MTSPVPPGAMPPRRPRDRFPAWARDWRGRLVGWWYSPSASELRAASLDTRRHLGLVVVGSVVVFWPLAGFTWLPLAVAAGAWLLVVLGTRWVHWCWRWRVRRIFLPAIGLLTLAVLTIQAGPLAWGVALGLWLVIAALTDDWRARRRLLAWVRQAVARSVRIDPGELHARGSEWDGRRLRWAEIDTRGLVAVEAEAVRERIATAVAWSLRHAGGYAVSWPVGLVSLEITADPALPEAVDEPWWPDGLPGIPIGVTDTDHADGIIDTVDALTGDVVASWPVLLVHPGDSQRHYLVVGGTGAGKSNFTRGFIARALRLGWFPGGCFIFDGKAGSDYIVFERREGIHGVAREPEEWEQHLAGVSAMMRARYDEDAAYHRGQRGRPDQPRWLVVLDEVQEIRTVLGRKVVDPFLQQISRQIRASNGRLMVVTQRPDTEDAVPGAVRDMLEERIILGFVSGTGARMVLDKDWQQATDEYGHTPVPGRGVARLAGRLVRLQSFRLDPPREHPELEPFYPPRTTASRAGTGRADEARSGTLPTTQTRWAPHHSDEDTPTPPLGVPTADVPTPNDVGGGRRPTV